MLLPLVNVFYSDECPPDRPHMCANGRQCISSQRVCDGTFDCLDYSDENNCTSKAAFYSDECTLDRPYKCANGQQCMSSDRLCDGKHDCSDHRDEVDCISIEMTGNNTCTMPNLETGHDSISEYKFQLLEALNYYRCIHGVPPLSLDIVLSGVASVHANAALTHGLPSITSCQCLPFGRNYKMYPVDNFSAVTGMETVGYWYRQMQFYNWDEPKPSALTDLFTQVIWKNTTWVGCGIAEGQGVYVVCDFFPKGNVNGTFIENVPRLTNFTTALPQV
ncbi:Golgi-associated plant pathogenesis-related protein 1-like [Saccoglossus kowalevskii]